MQTELLLNVIDEQEVGPSFFELFIMDQMYAMLKPAMRHVYQSFAMHSSHPHDAMDYFEPLYTILTTTLEATSLYNEQKQAGIMESIYGYQRVNDGTGGLLAHSSSSNLTFSTTTMAQKASSVAYVLLIPRILYLLQHIKEYARQLYASSTDQSAESNVELDEEELQNQQSYRYIIQQWTNFILRTTMRVYKTVLYYTTKALDIVLPHLLALEAISVTVMKLLYILKLTPYHHPLFALLGMRLVKKRLIQADTSSKTLNIQSSPTSPSSQRSWHLTAITAIIFTVRAIDWLVNTDHQTEHISQRISTPLPPPPPPQALKVAADGIIPHRNTRLCPICGQERQNPCATSSGYVFCYMCIFPVVRDTKQCPVTKLPCTEQDLIRLYENLNS